MTQSQRMARVSEEFREILAQEVPKLKDPRMATEFVRGHLVSGTVMPGDMTDGKTLTLMNGKTMTIRVMDGRMMVDDATITKAVKTNDGMIYVMDKIPSTIMTMLEQMGI